MMSYGDLFKVDATLVANEFLDKYMPSANGDYVKVYLYLLRNADGSNDIETIAERLELTEGDVRRAIKYWEKCGILSLGKKGRERSADSDSSANENAAAEQKSPADSSADKVQLYDSLAAGSAKSASAEDTAVNGEPAYKTEADPDAEIRNRYRRTEGKAVLNRLAADEEFKQLLFVVQKYRAKILTESEEQVLAYLYDGLGLSFDVLDYLVQYCVENGHKSMRYIEKTGLDWSESGIRTVEDAKHKIKEFERVREKSSRRTVSGKSTNGITRDNMDYDKWLDDYMQRNIR